MGSDPDFPTRLFDGLWAPGRREQDAGQRSVDESGLVVEALTHPLIVTNDEVEPVRGEGTSDPFTKDLDFVS